MKSAIICEGNTDLVLIQYFLEKTYNWTHIKKTDHNKYSTGIINTIPEKSGIKWFKHDNGNIMAIIAVGGTSKINNILSKLLDINSIELDADKYFEKIVVITDRDEVGTENDFIYSIDGQFKESGVNFNCNISNNNWNRGTFKNSIDEESHIEFLPLIIPFEDTGAMEIFLLKALMDESELKDPEKVDKYVIEQCIKFIDNIDCKGKYLNKRRHITKAKFSTVFSVMTPVEAFTKRDSLLRCVPWEEYETVQSVFKKLNRLLEK